jgi:restriction endonuclease S subunit
MASALIGSTPAEWEEIPLGHLCELIAGAAIADDPQGAVPIVKPKNLVAGRVVGPADSTSAVEASQRVRYQIREGDLLAARTGSIGRVSLAAAEQEGWIIGTGIIRIRVRSDATADPLFLSLYLSHPAIKDWFATHSSGTAIPSINTKTLGSLPVSLPPLNIQQAIAQTLDALNQKILVHQLICQATAEVRDALLPLLLSGRVTP